MLSSHQLQSNSSYILEFTYFAGIKFKQCTEQQDRDLILWV